MWWHTATHGRGSERGNWRMQWVTSTLHTTSEHGVSSITTADAHTSAASSRLNWRPPADLNGLVRFARKTKSGFCACAITFQLASTDRTPCFLNECLASHNIRTLCTSNKRMFILHVQVYALGRQLFLWLSDSTVCTLLVFVWYTLVALMHCGWLVSVGFYYCVKTSDLTWMCWYTTAVTTLKN